jgi:predicted HTH transcriptional regulator
MNNENIYKDNAESAESAFREELKENLEKNLSKFNDPVILGELIAKLIEERENTNRILKNILVKLETLEKEIATAKKPEEVLVPEIDEKIITFIKEQGKATAEDVRARFNYSGTNAASARLNRLCDLGLLTKKRVGKKVFFFPQ